MAADLNTLFRHTTLLTRRQVLELFDMGRVSDKMALYRLRRLAKKLDTLARKRKWLIPPQTFRWR
jgi:hypothetical protein